MSYVGALQSYEMKILVTRFHFYRGLMWFAFLHGQLNIAYVLTKQVRSTPEFKTKDGEISGFVPRVFETENMPSFLLNTK